jgi:cytochrome c peroxidase
MKQVQARLVEDEQLREQVRLISLSFDPELDTPQAMTQYAHHFKRKDFDWRFLTTDSEADLQPILQGFGQFRDKFYNEDGSYAGSMSHILRVYLIDRQKRIRNIYSAGFLHADTAINDLRTLLLEER